MYFDLILFNCIIFLLNRNLSCVSYIKKVYHERKFFYILKKYKIMVVLKNY